MEKKVKIRELEPKKRVGYIWEYYKFPILGVIIGIAIIGSFIWHFATQKDTLANVIMVNTISAEKEQNIFADFMKQNGYDASSEEIDLNDSLFADPQAKDSSSIYSLQSLQTIMMAGGDDVFLSDQKLFESLNSNGEFKDISKVLDKETMEKYKDDLITAKDPDTGEEYKSGIIVHSNKWLAKKGLYSGDVVIAVSAASKKDKINKEIIDYILSENGK